MSETITPEAYRALVEADAAAWRGLVRTRRRECCARHLVQVIPVTIAHPIWDGPFEGTGRGRCAYRRVPACRVCDGRARGRFESGPPVRIPWRPAGAPAEQQARAGPA